MSGASARTVAFDVLRAVDESDAYANLLLPARLERARLSSADAGLATELTYGTLRRRGYYDRVIELAARRPVSRIDEPVLDALRLGCHQLLTLRTPSHAAVNESVELVRSAASRSAVGFANGVLRTIARARPEVWRQRVADAARDDDDLLASLHSHPTWIVRALRHALAAEHREDELEALLEADNAAPRVNLAALPGVAVRPEDSEPDRYSPIGFVWPGGDPAAIVEATGGAIRVQDEGSQLAAQILVAARPPAAGERWLDLCAGPGGKAAVLASAAAAFDVRLVANEIVPARLELVRRAVAPVGTVVELTERDGTVIGAEEAAGYDRVLLDAPCTGLGALRRRPEARWRKAPGDVPELTRLQASLIDSAVAALRPGGILCYVTCSPHLAETRVQVSDALRRHPLQLRELPTQDVVQSFAEHPLDLAGDPAQVQLWPHRHGTDAMFVALFEKM
ncbi:RsmB/NOP family class I SAM-dependent RNA methyltransferase [Humibacter ginsenosidimutans]|uniref:rRNA small subunit methyltransferase B n=1 Tax=Humibacter ginsenosidimutans TaxID=2599293 RepID=A0A5B8M1K6_9MICO|nr:transcription antitermination factor NusB [Humibacter ginsenosidimutans]QDZ13824.1 rRNA small subunit methyltransferase B [Humibacter ginsenosidimutans]